MANNRRTARGRVESKQADEQEEDEQGVKPVPRPKRKTREELKRTAPGQARMKLTVSGLRDSSLRAYWSNEAQIPELESAGYRMAKKEDIERVGSAYRDRNNDPGSLVSVQSGSEKLYLMVIDKDLYAQYQEIKQEEVNRTEDAIRNPGALDANFYAPTNRNTVEEETF